MWGQSDSLRHAWFRLATISSIQRWGQSVTRKAKQAAKARQCLFGGGRRRIEKARESQSGRPFLSSEQGEFLQRFLHRSRGWRISTRESLVPAHQEAPDAFNERSASDRRAITTSNSGGAAMNMARICA